MDKDDNLKRLGDFLSQLFPSQSEEIQKWVPLHSRWHQIVGEGLDCHSRAREVIRGMLLVDVDHPAWMNLFQMRQEIILQKLQKGFPSLNIKSLRLRLVSDLRQPTVEPSVEEAPSPRSAETSTPDDLKDALDSLFKTIDKSK